MSRLQRAQAARRIKASTVRVESQPYDYGKGLRPPRLSGTTGVLWCQLSSTLAAATGTWPSLTPGTVADQTLYRSVNSALVALDGTWDVVNWYAATFATGKTTAVISNGDGTFSAIDQSC